MGPTFTGFVWWVTNIMGVPSGAVPPTDVLQTVYDWAVNVAYWGLATVPSQPTSNSIYAVAVYNLAGDTLVEWTQDSTIPNEDPVGYWSNLREQFGINTFTFGLVNVAHDQGTSEGMFIPEQLQGLTLFDLQLAKTPWGRVYLAIAGQWGAPWGLTA